ncbi:MAG: murein biosynthesis integral membrane protein MurJ [Gemmatimonadales bacterium]|nr:murein biosynthesis integral membrane protein MurJ [Gemmatimonadales bacterium]
MTAPRRDPARGLGAVAVGTAIFLSRIAGLVRTRVFGHFLGTSPAADAFSVAFRIPNVLQNLFGEGALSASFIPVYAGLLARGDDREARRVASAVAALLGLVVAVLVLLGVLAAPLLVDVLAPGFGGAGDPAGRHALAERLVRIVFPGTGLLVLSAWCLGVLNSHGRFFLAYAAPITWNAAIIAALVWRGGTDGDALAVAASWGALIGSALQLGVQLPSVLALLGGVGAPGALAGPVRQVVANFGPALLGRGVLQVSAYVDLAIASLLPLGAAAGLTYAQTLYLLPVSLFGLSISAAELPAMAREGAVGTDDAAAAALRTRLASGLGRIRALVVPSAVAFLVLGQVIAAALFQSGQFGAADSRFVWGIVAGAAPGLLATTQARLFSSAFYALQDTRTPLRIALVRVGASGLLGWLAAFHLPSAAGVDARWGAAGLTLAASAAGWLEWALLRRALARRVGTLPVAMGATARTWVAAAAAGAGGWLVSGAVDGAHPVVAAVLVLGAFGLLYAAGALALGVAEVAALLARLRGRVRRA